MVNPASGNAGIKVYKIYHHLITMKKNTFIILLILSCALLARPACAYYGASLDITVATAQVCPCDIVSSSEVTVKVMNYGSETDTYYMSMELPAGWSGFIEPELTLASGETATVNPVWITPSCLIEPGKYTITVVAESASSGKV